MRIAACQTLGDMYPHCFQIVNESAHCIFALLEDGNVHVRVAALLLLAKLQFEERQVRLPETVLVRCLGGIEAERLAAHKVMALHFGAAAYTRAVGGLLEQLQSGEAAVRELALTVGARLPAKALPQLLPAVRASAPVAPM